MSLNNQTVKALFSISEQDLVGSRHCAVAKIKANPTSGWSTVSGSWGHPSWKKGGLHSLLMCQIVLCLGRGI